MRLGHLAGRSFHEASLSEQRMLLLARALVKMPSMLILDEPCQGLDQSQTKRFTEMLDVICSKLDTTMIYVTHYPEEIPECVNYLLELENGQKKEIKEI
jgi:molybdate transport system ATP-binding protein